MNESTFREKGQRLANEILVRTETELFHLEEIERRVNRADSFFQQLRYVTADILQRNVGDGVKRKAMKGLLRVFQTNLMYSVVRRSDNLATTLCHAFQFSETPEGHTWWMNLYTSDKKPLCNFIHLETMVLLSDLNHRERQTVLRELRAIAKASNGLAVANGFLTAFNWEFSKRGFEFWKQISLKVARSKFWVELAQKGK